MFCTLQTLLIYSQRRSSGLGEIMLAFVLATTVTSRSARIRDNATTPPTTRRVTKSCPLPDSSRKYSRPYRIAGSPPGAGKLSLPGQSFAAASRAARRHWRGIAHVPDNLPGDI
jgi:hypothetical protein